MERFSETRLRMAGKGLALLGTVVGALALLGHLLERPLLASFVEGRPTMQPITAISIALAGLAVTGRCREGGPARGRAFCVLAGGIMLVTGLLTTFEHFLGVDLGVTWVTWADWSAMRPSLFTGLSLIFLGGALLVFDVPLPRGASAREWLLFASLFFAFVALVGHVFGAAALYEGTDRQVIGASLPAAIAIHLISAGAFLARPRLGVMGVATSKGPGGVLVRRLGAAAVLSAPLFGALLLVLVRSFGLHDPEMIVALGAVAGAYFAPLFVVVAAVRVERSYRAELAARHRISEFLEQAPVGVFVADLEGRYTEVNTAGCQLLDYSRDELIGKSIVDLIPEEDVERLERSRERMLAAEADVDDWRLRRRDGSYVPVEITAKILPDGRWQAFVSDITERVELERKLRESRDFLTSVLESSTEYGLIAQDLERRIVLWNEGARRTYGYSSSEALGMDAKALVAETEAAKCEALRTRALEEGSAEGTLSAVRKDGELFSARFVCTRRLYGREGTVGILTVSRDISAEQRRLAEQEFFARVGIELASCFEFRQAVTLVARLTVSFLGDMAGVDVLRDGSLQRAAVVHRDPSKAKIAEALLRMGAERPVSHPVSRALESQRAFIVEATGEELIEALAISPEHRRALEAADLHSLILAPLVARGQLFAVLYIASCDASRTYGPADLRVAQSLAERAALTLDNVQLFQQSLFQGAVTTNLAEGVVVFRAEDARIVYANPRLEAMFGYGPGELIGKPAHVLHADGEPGPEEQIDSMQAELASRGAWHGETRNVRKDGSRVCCSVGIVESRHEEHGQVWIAVYSDISERKRLEEKNARALREKEVLLKEIHHRVKNNLQVISSLFALQRERTESDDLRTLLDESRMRVQSIALVHEQLYRSADLAIIDLDEYLRGLLAAIRSSYGAERVSIEASAKDVALDVEEAVPCALLISEIVSNSLKHAFPGRGGHVWVRARGEPEGCVLEVGDDGVGIPADFDWTTSRSLGLRLVQSLTRQLRGTIELDCSRGTRYVARFPLRHAPAAADERARRPQLDERRA